jgi:hypothetical protein
MAHINPSFSLSFESWEYGTWTIEELHVPQPSSPEEAEGNDHDERGHADLQDAEGSSDPEENNDTATEDEEDEEGSSDSESGVASEGSSYGSS